MNVEYNTAHKAWVDHKSKTIYNPHLRSWVGKAGVPYGQDTADGPPTHVHPHRLHPDAHKHIQESQSKAHKIWPEPGTAPHAAAGPG